MHPRPERSTWLRPPEAAGRGYCSSTTLTPAAPSTQRAFLRVVLERVVRDLVLPDTVAAVAAANLPDDAGGYELTETLANRFVHIDCRPDLEAWLEYTPCG
jgi:MoxR-like ATPase